MKDAKSIAANDLTLDPDNWDNMRQLAHLMVDDMMDYLQNIKEEPSWKPFPQHAKDFLQEPIPMQPESAEKVYSSFKENILPYAKGNIHPRFFSWVEGTGTPMGAMAELLAASMNSNVGIGEHAAMYVDYQVVEWCKQMMNFPSTASGILLSGGSMANITALAVARNHQSGKNIRKDGLTKPGLYLTLYCSSETHSCIQKAAEVLGLGTDSVRKIAVDNNYRIDTIALVKKIEEDIENGFTPFCIVGNAGTVNTAAIDPLAELLEIRDRYKLWLHIDGAFGALAKLVPEYAESLKAIEQADSVAFDLHKWMYMPYEVGCTLIRNSDAHRKTFAITPNYLLKHERGLAAGPEPMNNFGLELSRGFKALKVWMSIKENGLKKYADMIRQNIAQAYYLGELVEQEDRLELLAPVSMNIVCFRYRNEGLSGEILNNLNKEIVMQLQEEGIASPSSTILNENYAIRVAITNQRSRKSDFELLTSATMRLGKKLEKDFAIGPKPEKNIPGVL